MAEIIVKAQDGPEGLYQWLRGMPVAVLGNDALWGSKEGPPIFFLLKIPLMSVAAFKPYLVERENVKIRRQFTLSSECMDAIEANGGTVTMTPAEFQEHVIDGAA